MILDRHPEVAKLLVPTKPYSLLIAPLVITFSMAVTYLTKDASWPVFLAVVYIIGGTCGHTLHVLIHDFTHWGGHSSITVNKIMAVLCNIPMGVPTALSFGKYHSDHHNYLGEERKDPDLPLRV